MAKQNQADQSLLRVVDDSPEVDLREQLRLGEPQRTSREDGKGQKARHDMCSVKRESSAQNAQRCGEPFANAEPPAISERNGHTGNQHKGLCGIGEAEILVRYVFEILSRHVVDENNQ